MKKWIGCMTVLLVTLSVFGKYGGAVRLDRRDGKYKVGDTITCRVKLTNDSQALKGTKARMTVKFEGKVVKTKDFTTTGEMVPFTYAAQKPGWVYFGVEVLNDEGRVLTGKEVFRYPHKKSIVLEIGAVINQDEIVAGAKRPDDFEAFWAARRAKLNEVPIKAKLEPMKYRDKNIRLYKVTIPTVGEYPVTGYLAIPVNAKPKSCRAFVEWSSWSASDANRNSAIKHAVEGDIGFTTTWHGRPVDMGKAWYDYKKTIKIKGGMVGIEDRDTWCFGFMYYRVMRALDYVKTRPEWDGRNLISIGGSLGGAQSTAAAALDKDVTVAVIVNPCFCEFDGAASGRTGSIPRYAGAKSPEALKAQSYYDCVNFAPMIKCPVFISTGGTDELCPPSNVFSVFNALPKETKAKSQMFFNPAVGHYGQINKSANPRIKKLLNSVVINRYDEKN